jgi:TetR/AcrR family transcriptional regulator, transcriptional repressor for nem operon
MKETRDHIIELADQHVRSKGFNAFSYMHIAGIMDIRKAGIHYYFPAKSDLGNAVIEAEIARIRIQRDLSRHLPGDEQLKKLIAIFYHHSKKDEICLNGALTSDYYTFAPPMQLMVQRMSNLVLEWTADCLEKGRSQARLHFAGTAADRALLLLSALMSSLLLARVLGREIFDRTVNLLLADMQAPWNIADLPPASTRDDEPATIRSPDQREQNSNKTS